MNMLDCVMHAEDAGIFTVNPQTVSNLAMTHHVHSELVTSSSEVESKWKSAYNTHQDRWKKKTAGTMQTSATSQSEFQSSSSMN